MFIFARNHHVSGLLRARYETQSQIRRIEIFCVSNSLYGEAQAQRRDLEARLRTSAASGRQSNAGVIAAKTAAIQAKIDGSGIAQLREYCQNIPSRSQIVETRHFLNTKVLELVQKVGLWYSARSASENSRQAPPEVLNRLQAGLRAVSFLYVDIWDKTKVN